MVSIIVPIYNVERYISRCVESLIQQDYKDIQIILVDDGSTDRSLQIVNNLAKTDERIVVIHKNNSGVSSARNNGIKAAIGDYLMFVDGDDYVESDYVSYFVNLIEMSDCDVGFNINYYSIESDCSGGNSFVISSEKAIEWIYSGKIFVAVWNKIYRNTLLKQTGVSFNEEIWFGEGMLFNIECLQNVEKVAVGERAVYHQTFNPNSAMRLFNLESHYCGIRSLEMQKCLWKKRTKKIEQAWEYHYYRFNKIIIAGLVRSKAVEENRAAFDDCVKKLRDGIWIVFKNERNLKEVIKWMLYYVAPLQMAMCAAKKFEKVVHAVERELCPQNKNLYFDGGVNKLLWFINVATISTGNRRATL